MSRKAAAAMNARAAGLVAPTASAAPKEWAPDLSRMRTNIHDADDEARRMRLRAKTINFTCTFVARSILILCTVLWIIESGKNGTIDPRRFLAVFVQLADMGRVFNKMMTPGTK